MSKLLYEGVLSGELMKTLPSEKILVVEHERIIAMDIDCILRGSGYTDTTLAFSIEEAMRKIPAIKPDLVLIDDQICGVGDEKDDCRKIVESFNIPILYLSSSSPLKLRRDRRDRYTHYLHKPFDADEVSSSVKRILSKGRK